jgi:glycosyltransferase involved in cell wall biosynthesis
MTSKHIAFISLNQFDPYLRDGGSRGNVGYLRFLQNCNCTVSLINFLCSDYYDCFFHNMLEDQHTTVVCDENTSQGILHGLDYYQVILPVPLRDHVVQTPLILKIIMQHMEKHGIGIALTADESCTPLLAAHLLKIPAVQFFHAEMNIERFVGKHFYIRLLRQCPVFANSRFIQSRVRGLLGIESSVWYNFVDIDAVRNNGPQCRTNAIGFSSSQGKIKGDDIVAAIAAGLPERRFIVAGGKYTNANNPLLPNVTYLGHVTDMKDFYRHIDLLLVPSIGAEGFGLVIPEAAANGIPVIANRIGGIPEALGDSGILIDYNPEQDETNDIARQYVNNITALLDDGAYYETLRRRSLDWADRYKNIQMRQSQTIYETYFS